MTYSPPFTISPKILDNVMRITEALTQANLGRSGIALPHLRRTNRLRSLHSSLAIEGNGLSLDEVTAVIEGKTVAGPKDEITEVRNAYAAYEDLDSFDPFEKEDILRAHAVMMEGLVDSAGSFRTGSEGVFDGEGNIVYIAPGPEFVPLMMDNLLRWTKESEYSMIVKSCVFHYQFEYIHPFEDGNGRIGRLWQTLLLSRFDASFKWMAIESVIRKHQKGYYDAIERSNQVGDCTVFVEFMTGVIYEALTETAVALVGEEAGRVRMSSKETALYTLIRDGYFTDIDQAAELMGVSRPTLSRCIRSLKDKGLIEKEGNRKSGVWHIVRSDEGAD